jgi:hypothetical protein
MKPDGPTAAIVAALRQIGASVEYHTGSPGSPDLIIGYKGRMWFVEVKDPSKPHGVCGCTHTDVRECGEATSEQGGSGFVCYCKGHTVPAGERKVWHRQLAWHENWQGPPVIVWTSVEQAIETITKETKRYAL